MAEGARTPVCAGLLRRCHVRPGRRRGALTQQMDRGAKLDGPAHNIVCGALRAAANAILVFRYTSLETRAHGGR